MSKSLFTSGIDNHYNCSHCKWEGNLPDFVDGNKTEKYLVYDVFCPTCKKPLGCWQAPLIIFLLPKDKRKSDEIVLNWFVSVMAIMKIQQAYEAKQQNLCDQPTTIQKPAKIHTSPKENKPKQLKLFKD